MPGKEHKLTVIVSQTLRQVTDYRETRYPTTYSRHLLMKLLTRNSILNFFDSDLFKLITTWSCSSVEEVASYQRFEDFVSKWSYGLVSFAFFICSTMDVFKIKFNNL